MGEIVEKAVYSIFGNMILALVIIPNAVIFLGYLIYIVIMSVRESRK